MFKLAWSYCYVLCMSLWFRLRLNNSSKIPPRDLPWDKMVMAGKVCEGIWAGIYQDCHLWWFWNSPLNNSGILKKTIECFIKVCPDPGNARDLQLAALCWGLAHAYQRVNNIIQHPQEEENASGSDPTLVTDAAANPTPATGPAAPAAPKTGATAEPVSSPILVSITPTFKNNGCKSQLIW